MERYFVGANIKIKGIEYTYAKIDGECFDDYFDAKKYAIDLTTKIKAKDIIIRVYELIENCWHTCFELRT